MARTCIIVSHTHWDREWYQPYQLFRLRLVRLMDRLLHILDEDPSYGHFMLDGQTIILEDYLQIRPEREAALRHYVHQGRLLIGPWYVLPDEFLVSGEAMVRNLLFGERMAREFGAKMMVGYTPDPFGHISQLPQILRGFGIENTALRRGLDDQPAELLWQAPDGSTVLLCYLRDGYDNAARLPLHDEQALATEIVRLYNSLAPYAATDYVLLMNGTDHMEPSPESPQALAAASRRLPDMRLLHGTLPMYVNAVKESLQLSLGPTAATAPGILQTIQGELRSPKRHHLLPGVLSARMWIKQRNNRIQNLLEKWTEPFAALAALEGAGAHGLSNPDSAFAAVWQAWTYLLQNHPHDSICGCSVDQTHREMVTRFDWAEQIAEEITQQSLASIANQINTQPQGSQTQAVRVPLVVFNPLTATRSDLVTTSIQLPGSLEEFVVADVAGQVKPHQVLARKGAEFATLQLGRDEVLGLATMIEMISTLGLSVQEMHITSEGEAATIDVTLVEHGHTDPALVAEAQRQIEAILAEDTVQTFHVRAHQATTVEFLFVAEGVPGCGYKTYFLVERPQQPTPGDDSVVATSVAEPDSRTTQVVTTGQQAVPKDGSVVATLVADPDSKTTDGPKSLHMENEFLAVDIHPQDGTLTILDKQTGATFSGLHRFVDGGDRGDEYNYCPAKGDEAISAPASPPEITWLEQGPVRWTIQVSQCYHLPASLIKDRSGRSKELVEVPLTSQIHLSLGVPRLDFRTEVDNQARDHRLRVHFPTPVHAKYSEAESSFDVVQRPLGVPDDTADWVEQPVPTHPQKSFVDVNDGAIGLLVINRGLPEYEVLQEEDGSATVALTLLRCVGWLSRDDYPCRKGHAGPALETPEAQCLGHHVFEYALVPHAGTWQHAYPEAHAFNAPLRAVVTQQHDGSLPLTQSLICLQGDGLVLSAVKAAEAGDGLIVRFYNVNSEPSVAHLQSHTPTQSATLVNLAEQELQPLSMDGSGWITVEVQGKQIATVKLTF